MGHNHNNKDIEHIYNVNYLWNSLRAVPYFGIDA